MTSRKNEQIDGQRAELRASDIMDPNSQIGVRLRSLYAAVQEEAIPDRFLDLLEKLDQAELASAKAAK
ncbi:NepR family anti-sigma factor [Rhizobium sp. AN80A]|uniref:NepR family anti-sigma factor n=1 Tax=Rhizobium sp. AN80A TaxID=3040673 RepID=UPI0024B325A8|nr:NepR family anti-sigma factor [Rhizobium sp. AN80A]